MGRATSVCFATGQLGSDLSPRFYFMKGYRGKHTPRACLRSHVHGSRRTLHTHSHALDGHLGARRGFDLVREKRSD